MVLEYILFGIFLVCAVYALFDKLNSRRKSALGPEIKMVQPYHPYYDTIFDDKPTRLSID